MRRHRQDLAPQADINITNMLDVAFILLIVFMIVAPNLKHGLEIELPTVTETKAIDVKEPAVISIRNRKDRDDLPSIYLDDQRVEVEDIRKQLLVRLERHPDLAVLVRCDHREEAGILLQVVGAIQGAGIESVSVETETK